MKTTESTPSFLTPYRWLGVASILLAVGIVMIYTPADLYARNSAEFTFPLTVLLAKAAWGAAGLAGLFCLPLLVPVRKIVTWWACGWFATAMCVWVSVNFLVLDSGVLDGQETTLTVSQEFTAGSLAVLTIAAAAALWIAMRRPKGAMIGALALSCVLAVSGVAGAYTGASVETQGTQASVRDRLYQFSRTNNALVILLDTFQADLFQEIVDRDERLKAVFDGFTYYPDTVGAAASTFMSLPAIHSGEDLDLSRPVTEAYRELVRKRSFLVAMAKTGWDAFLLNNVTGVCPEATTCTSSEVIVAGMQQAVLWEYAHLLDLSVFRALPAPLKRYMYNSGAWQLQRRLNDGVDTNRAYRGFRVLRDLGSRLTVSGDKPSVKMLHLLVTHPPVELDQDCRPLTTPARLTRDGLREQSRCAVEALGSIFEALKKHEIYDLTSIAIIADHGAGMESKHFSDTSKVSEGWRALVGTANPLLLFKPRAKRGAMEVSSRQARIADIAAMVCGDSGACRHIGGVDMQNTDPGERARVFVSHRWTHDFWKKAIVPNMKPFEIRGPIWKESSWTRNGVPEIGVGEDVAFVPDSSSEQMLSWGWWDPEPWGVWSRGNEAVISFRPTPKPSRPLKLIARVRGSVSSTRQEQSVKVEANGHPVGTWRFDRNQPHGIRETLIPAKAISGEDLDVRFVVENSGPQENSSEVRAIGVGLEVLRLEEQ